MILPGASGIICRTPLIPLSGALVYLPLSR